MRPLIGTLKQADYAEISDGVFAAQYATNHFKANGARIEIPTEHRWWEYGTAIQMLLNHYGADIHKISVLDVGSGWGAFGPALAYMYEGIQVMECEPGGEREDRKRVNSILAAVGKRQMDVRNHTTDDLPEEQFDMVACISVIEHMPATVEARAWKNLVDRIKPGGLFFADVDCVFDQTKSYVFDELRAHNFTCEEMKERVQWLKDLGMEVAYGEDYTYNGNTVHDFTFFRIGMRKKQ